MANINFGDLSVEHGFNYQKDAQFPVGFITTLTIGTKVFAPDMNVQWPSDEQFHKVVAVLKSVEWNGGMGDPINFVGMVSSKNKSDIEILRHQKLSATNVSMGFIVFDFDHSAATPTYFTAMGMNPINPTGGPAMSGLLHKESNKLSFEINLREDTTVKNPKNYEFKIGVMPSATAQSVMFATGTGDSKVGKPWGITVGA